MWLSRIGDRPHIFLGLGQFGTIFTVVSDNHVLFGRSWRIVLKNGARFTNLASRVGKKSISP